MLRICISKAAAGAGWELGVSGKGAPPHNPSDSDHPLRLQTKVQAVTWGGHSSSSSGSSGKDGWEGKGEEAPTPTPFLPSSKEKGEESVNKASLIDPGGWPHQGRDAQGPSPCSLKSLPHPDFGKAGVGH